MREDLSLKKNIRLRSLNFAALCLILSLLLMALDVHFDSIGVYAASEDVADNLSEGRETADDDAADGHDGTSAGAPIKICIDPGHGGENEGGLWEDYVEKEMTLIVAEAMRDELLKYDGIEVYMTRTKDVDMSLEERVDYAAEVGADFFFCLHFNLSADHDMYGAECWISAFDKKYARGYDFASIEMKLLTDTGLYDRGIKTRLNSKRTNYYGVLRMCDLEDIPGIIIEHCHLDHEEDMPYYDHHDMLVEYGKLDATAVAMYYGLRSDELGKDFSDYTYEHTPVPSKCVRPDETEPEYVDVSLGETEYVDDHYEITADISAYDPDCRMLYYSYTYDGGAHWSKRYRWESTVGSGQATAADDGENSPDGAGETDTISGSDKNSGKISVHLDLPAGRDASVRIRAYNLYNLHSESESFYITGLDEPEIEEEPETEPVVEYTDIIREDEDENPAQEHGSVLSDKKLAIMLGILAVGILIMSIVLAAIVVNNSRRYKRRR